MPAFQLGGFADCGNVAAGFREAGEELLADLGVGQLPAAEAHGDLQPVPVRQEFLAVLQLRIEVVDADARRHTDLLDLDDPLVLLRLLLPLGLLEAVLPVVHDLADRGIGCGRDLDQVQILFCRDVQRRRRGHDAELSAVAPNEADLLIPDVLIDLMCCVADAETPPKKSRRPQPAQRQPHFPPGKREPC